MVWKPRIYGAFLIPKIAVLSHACAAIYVCIVDIKVLIGILGRPWLMEPNAARHWEGAVNKFISSGTTPLFDKRTSYEGYGDTGPVFKIDETGAVNRNGSIQVFKMDAPIAKNDYCGSPGSQTWVQHLAAANADPSVSSILLWIDSPGGQVDGTEALANAIRNSAKPVISFSDSVMASAAYWIGSSASVVIADGANNGWNATIGSIGTMCAMYDDAGALEKEGYKRHLVFADASSDKWGDYFKVMKGEYGDLKKALNGINDSFLSAVKANRKGKLSKTENVLTGKVYNANEALEFGLIDKIGDFSVAVEATAAAGKKYKKNNRTKNDDMQNVLIAANAENFPFAEGATNSFIVSEEQMNSVDAKLAENATLIRTLTQTNETLQAKADAVTTEAADTAALQAAVTAAEEKAATLEAANTKLAADLAAANEAKALFLGEKGGAQDKGGAHEAKTEDQEVKELVENAPHVQEANKTLNIK